MTTRRSGLHPPELMGPDGAGERISSDPLRKRTITDRNESSLRTPLQSPFLRINKPLWNHRINQPPLATLGGG